MAGIEIVWVKSVKVNAFRHGMVGGVRAFTLDVQSRPYELHCKLPGPLGAQQIEKFTTEQAAHTRAAEKITEFLQLLGQAHPSPGSAAADSDRSKAGDEEGPES